MNGLKWANYLNFSIGCLRHKRSLERVWYYAFQRCLSLPWERVGAPWDLLDFRFLCHGLDSS
jgi:hypothetical protein